MALLSNLPRSRVIAPLGALALLAVAGCTFINSLRQDEPRFAFSHRIHVEEMDCTGCHPGAEDEEEAGIPRLQQCLLCHEEGDEEQPPERRIEALFAQDEFLASNVYALDDDVIFSHPDHASMGDCSACHEGIEESDDVRTLAPVSMDDCTACHETLNVPNDCTTCHREYGRDWAPDNHHHSWVRAHGRAFQSESDAVAMRCDMCHASSTCDACHLVTPPQTHTNYWRRRGHGIVSSMDRASCATCHRDDFCTRCHEQAIPMNHAGMWGNPRNNHCLTCHFPLRAEGCVTCHQVTPSHLGAAPLPPDHSPAMNCRQCHGLSAPLPHVDKGDECILCHR